MANINLSTGQMNRSTGESPNVNLGMVIAFIILLGMAGIATFLVIKEKSLTTDVATAETAYTTALADLTTGRNMDVIDLQSRIFKLKEVVNQRNSTTDSILNVEKFLVAGVVVKSFGYKDAEKTMELTCVAGDYDMVARQVASFKNSEYFPEVILKDAKVNAEGGGIEFSVTIVGK